MSLQRRGAIGESLEKEDIVVEKDSDVYGALSMRKHLETPVCNTVPLRQLEKSNAFIRNNEKAMQR